MSHWIKQTKSFYLDPRVALFAFLTILLAVILLPLKTPLWKFYIFLGWLLILGLIIYRDPKKMWNKWRGPFLLFLSFFIILIPLTLIFSTGSHQEAIFILEQIGLRMALVLVAEGVFILSYRVEDLLSTLNQGHLPQSVVQLLTSAIRYSQLLAAEAVSNFRAYKARAGGKRPLTEKLKTTGLIIEKLFIRAYERSERIYAAMLSRGYEGQLYFQKSFLLRTLDWVFLFTELGLLAIICII